MSWPELTNEILSECMDAFGVPVRHRPAAGGSHDRVGIFSGAHRSVTFQGEVEVSSTSPALGIQLATWNPAPVTEDAIDVLAGPGQGTYEVDDLQPDGEGGSSLVLKRKAA